jgi:hypothetical protein
MANRTLFTEGLSSTLGIKLPAKIVFAYDLGHGKNGFAITSTGVYYKKFLDENVKTLTLDEFVANTPIEVRDAEFLVGGKPFGECLNHFFDIFKNMYPIESMCSFTCVVRHVNKPFKTNKVRLVEQSYAGYYIKHLQYIVIHLRDCILYPWFYCIPQDI